MPWFSVSLLAWGTEIVQTVWRPGAQGRAVEESVCQPTGLRQHMEGRELGAFCLRSNGPRLLYLSSRIPDRGSSPLRHTPSCLFQDVDEEVRSGSGGKGGARAEGSHWPLWQPLSSPRAAPLLGYLPQDLLRSPQCSSSCIRRTDPSCWPSTRRVSFSLPDCTSSCLQGFMGCPCDCVSQCLDFGVGGIPPHSSPSH